MPSDPVWIRYGGPSHCASVFVSCGNASGPPIVRGANAGEPTIEPANTWFTQSLSVKMYTRYRLEPNDGTVVIAGAVGVHENPGVNWCGVAAWPG